MNSLITAGAAAVGTGSSGPGGWIALAAMCLAMPSILYWRWKRARDGNPAPPGGWLPSSMREAYYEREAQKARPPRGEKETGQTTGGISRNARFGLLGFYALVGVISLAFLLTSKVLFFWLFSLLVLITSITMFVRTWRRANR